MRSRRWAAAARQPRLGRAHASPRRISGSRGPRRSLGASSQRRRGRPGRRRRPTAGRGSAWLQSPGCKGVGLITHWTTEATSADRCGARCPLAAQRTPPPRRHCMHSPTSPAPHTTAHNLGLAALDAHMPADCVGPHVRGLPASQPWLRPVCSRRAPPVLLRTRPITRPAQLRSLDYRRRRRPPPPAGGAAPAAQPHPAAAALQHLALCGRAVPGALPGARQGGRQRHSRLRVKLEQYRWRGACAGSGSGGARDLCGL